MVHASRDSLNILCLDVMFVCSVSTLIFNANPLMRYDGYYILSDLLEIPNLRQKASLVLQRKAAAWVLGMPEPPDPFLPRRRIWLFALYSIASACYGWFVSLSIFWFLYRALEPWGLKVLGQAVAGLMVFNLVILPAWRLAKFFHVPGRATKVKKLRAAVILGLSAAALIGLLCVPLPYYIACSFYVQPRGGTSVYVDVPGEVRQIHLQSGEVHAGEPLLTLENIDARLSQRKLESEREQLAAQLDALRQRAHTDDTAHLELAEGNEALAAVDAQLARRREEIKKLTVVAPVDGIVVPAPTKAPFTSTHGTLATWSGRPLELHNVGAYLEPSTLICHIAQPGELEAILAISQDELEFVSPDQLVDLFLSTEPNLKRTSSIEHISQQQMQAAPRNLTLKSGGDMATRTDETGLERPVDVTYQASTPLSDSTGLLLPELHRPRQNPRRLSTPLPPPLAHRLPDVPFPDVIRVGNLWRPTGLHQVTTADAKDSRPSRPPDAAPVDPSILIGDSSTERRKAFIGNELDMIHESQTGVLIHDSRVFHNKKLRR